MKQIKLLSLTALLGLATAVQAQSPWTQKKNKAYVQASFTSISNYDKLYGDPDYATERKITDQTIQLYGEYGVSDATTLFATVPLKMMKAGDLVVPGATPWTAEASESKLGNIQFGVKHNFYNKKWIISGQLGIEANTSSYDAASGLRSGFDAWSFSPMVLVGRGFSNWYIQAFTGADVRTNAYSSNYRLGGELGYKAVSWLWVAGFLDGSAALGNGDRVVPVNNRLTGLYVNNISYAAFGLKLIGEINQKFGVNAAMGGAFGGRNVAKKPAFTFGVYYKL